MPQNRRGNKNPKTAHLKPTQFKPGESGNPGGRPKRKPITQAYEKLGAKLFPGDPQGRTYAELLAEAQYREAIKGETTAAKEITDRVEGKASQSVELTGPDGGSIEVNVNDVRDKLLAKLVG